MKKGMDTGQKKDPLGEETKPSIQPSTSSEFPTRSQPPCSLNPGKMNATSDEDADMTSLSQQNMTSHRPDSGYFSELSGPTPTPTKKKATFFISSPGSSPDCDPPAPRLLELSDEEEEAEADEERLRINCGSSGDDNSLLSASVNRRLSPPSPPIDIPSNSSSSLSSTSSASTIVNRTVRNAMMSPPQERSSPFSDCLASSTPRAAPSFHSYMSMDGALNSSMDMRERMHLRIQNHRAPRRRAYSDCSPSFQEDDEDSIEDSRTGSHNVEDVFHPRPRTNSVPSRLEQNQEMGRLLRQIGDEFHDNVIRSRSYSGGINTPRQRSSSASAVSAIPTSQSYPGTHSSPSRMWSWVREHLWPLRGGGEGDGVRTRTSVQTLPHRPQSFAGVSTLRPMEEEEDDEDCDELDGISKEEVEHQEEDVLDDDAFDMEL